MKTLIPALRLTVLLLVTVSIELSIAEPFDTGFLIWHQPNGVVFTARCWGDEFISWFETREGYRIAQARGGWSSDVRQHNS